MSSPQHRVVAETLPVVTGDGARFDWTTYPSAVGQETVGDESRATEDGPDETFAAQVSAFRHCRSRRGVHGSNLPPPVPAIRSCTVRGAA